jgi:malonate transporter and related proteins
MIDVLNLSLPYFGLIFIGFVCGKARNLPESGLAWLNFLLLYIALPALFFRTLAKTPFEQLNNLPFVVATTCATALAFAVAAALAFVIRRRRAREATMAGLAGAYGNIGYMGPGLALATFGQAAAAPVALIFCFDSVLLFSVAPLAMALLEAKRRPLLPTILSVARQIVFHPLIVASWLGVLAAAIHFDPPVAVDRTLQFLQNAAAPVALFALGVTVALRPFDRVPWEVPAVVAVKLLIHPLLALALLTVLGPFDGQWVATAMLMASLPPALNAFIIARQYDTWVEAASTAVLFGTMASVLTLTTFLWLLQTGRLAL